MGRISPMPSVGDRKGQGGPKREGEKVMGKTNRLKSR